MVYYHRATLFYFMLCLTRTSLIVKVKGKIHPTTDHEGPGGVEVYLYSFFNLGDRWGGWSTRRPSHFTPGKDTRYLLYMRLGGPQAGLDGCGKSCPHRDSIPVASRYADYAIPPHTSRTVP